MRHTTRLWMTLFVCLGLAAGCSSGDAKKMQLPEPPPTETPEAEAPKEAQPAGSPDKPTPKADAPSAGDLLRASGTTEPLRASRVASSVMGRVLKIEVEEGQQVEEGQVLVRLDVRSAQLQVSQASSQAAAARVNAAQLSHEVERMKPLVAKGVVPEAQLEQLVAQQKAAAWSARSASGSAGLARKQVLDGVIRAPFSGRVLEIPVEIGEMVSPGPSPVVRLADLSRLKVRVPLHERALPRLKEGQPVIATFPSLKRQVKGEVTLVGFEVDEDTRTVEVTAEIDNASGLLRAGMFVEVAIEPIELSDATPLPGAKGGNP